ncbi:MAG: hypothetical protein Kow0090_18780 [Myxococcota bacterium]
MIKSMMYGGLFVFAVIVTAVFATACSSGPKPQPPATVIANELDGAPDWVVKGCSAYWGDKKERKICGVGSMGGTRNASLARTTAISRGRTEIARSLEVTVKGMVKDYAATTTGGEEFGIAAADEQHVVDVTKQITDMTLAGTQMIDSWISGSGTFYALVVLDVEQFKDTVNKMKNLSNAVREHIVKNAEKAFDELDKEIDKERNK